MEHVPDIETASCAQRLEYALGPLGHEDPGHDHLLRLLVEVEAFLT